MNDRLTSIGSVQSQNIIFDVSQPLEEIQAPQDAVKSTAIALVKVDSTFLPGTTIGATQWVAYAMTKGMFSPSPAVRTDVNFVLSRSCPRHLAFQW